MLRNHADLANILENCLKQIEAGRPIDEVVNEVSSSSKIKGEELKAILLVAQAAIPPTGSLRVPASAQRDSRQRFLAKAQKLNQQPGAASLFRWRRFLRFFQVNFGSVAFVTATILLLFIALGSVRSLPGDGLYPVKLAAEQASISLSSNTAEREALVSGYDTVRAEEVATMIQRHRTGTVSFGGFLTSTKENRWMIDDISLQLSDPQKKQAPGLENAYVEVNGYLDSNGQVQVKTLDPRLEAVQGVIANMTPDGWKVNGMLIRVSPYSKVNGNPEIGSQVTIQAARLKDTADLLAITAQADLGKPAQTTLSSQQMSETEAAPTLETPEPTATNKTPINAKPIFTATPAGHSNDQSSGDHQSGSDHETPEPSSHNDH